MRARERYRVTETTAGIPGGMYRKLEDSHGCFQGRKRGWTGGRWKVWEEGCAAGEADTRKSGVAEMGKREEKRRDEKRREEKRQRLAGDTGTSIIHVVCLLHLLPPFVVFHDLRSL